MVTDRANPASSLLLREWPRCKFGMLCLTANPPIWFKQLRNSSSVCSSTTTNERYRHYINDILDGYMCVGTGTEVFRRNCEDKLVK